MKKITGQEDISYRAEDLADSTELGTSALIFAHEASGGESSIDLTAITTPAVLSANGFTNPSPAEIAAARLLFYRKNLRLYSSVRGRMHDYDAYVVSTSTVISFVGFTLLPGEIIKGEVSETQRTGTVLADLREFRTTYFLPAGQTVVPLGVTYRVNANSAMQGSSVRVYQDGIRIVRNENNAAASPSANGNYHEIDTGSGYGNSIELNVPAGINGSVIDVDFGVFTTEGSVELFSSLERLAGICYGMASDLALATGNPVSNYMTASLSEIDRATYAATVLDHEARLDSAETIRNTYQQVVSSTKVPVASGTYLSMTGNNIVIPPGQIWELNGTVRFANNGSNPGYSYVYGIWAAVNGGDGIVFPTLPALQAGSLESLINGLGSSSYVFMPMPTLRVGTGTYYLVPYAVMTTFGNALISTVIYGKRVK